MRVLATGLPSTGWKNVVGSSGRPACTCGTWMDHWKKYANQFWPSACAVSECSNTADRGGHVVNPNVAGEKIVPMCASCNGRTDSFALKNTVARPSANRADTCDKSSGASHGVRN